MRGLARAEVMRASEEEIRAVAENVLLVATFWLSFNAVRGVKAEPRSRSRARHSSGDAADRTVPARRGASASEYAVQAPIGS